MNYMDRNYGRRYICNQNMNWCTFYGWTCDWIKNVQHFDFIPRVCYMVCITVWDLIHVYLISENRWLRSRNVYLLVNSTYLITYGSINNCLTQFTFGFPNACKPMPYFDKLLAFTCFSHALVSPLHNVAGCFIVWRENRTPFVCVSLTVHVHRQQSECCLLAVSCMGPTVDLHFYLFLFKFVLSVILFSLFD